MPGKSLIFRPGSSPANLPPIEFQTGRILPEHRQLAAGLNNLAECYYRRGHYREAEALLQRSLSIKEKAFGPNDPSVAETLKDYAAVLRKMKQKSEAATVEARAKTICARCGPACQTSQTVDVLALRSAGR